MTRLICLLSAIGFAVLPTASALACPVCDTPTGRAVREGIFDASFGEHVALTLAPFVVLGLIVAVLHNGIPLSRRGSRRRDTDDPRGPNDDF